MGRKEYILEFVVILVVGLLIGFVLGRFLYSLDENKARTMYFRAQTLLREGKKAQSEGVLNQLLLQYPQTRVADNANDALNEISVAKNEEAHVLYEQAIEKFESCDYLKAQGLLTKIISEYPKLKLAGDAKAALARINEGYFNSCANKCINGAVTWQKAYYIEHGMYSKYVEGLTGLHIPPDVELAIQYADKKKYVMEAFHKKGGKAYRIQGPGGTVKETSRQ
jgi:tetratricopeptide (TPR) repeat protein